MSKRSGVDIQTTVYKTFKGADFTTDPALVDRQRSPLCTNMMSDEGGNPEKRPGYKRVCLFSDGTTVNGIYRMEYSGVQHYLAHVGTKLYRWYPTTGTYTQLATGFPNAKSMAVYLNGKLYIFTGSGLYTYNGTTVQLASVGAYVPLTVIGCKAGSTPGGSTYEGINYLSNQQRVSFLAVTDTADYHLPYTDLTSVDLVTVDGTVQTAGTAYTVNLSTGVVTFTSGHIPSPPSAGAADNVEIKFTKTISGYADRINKCTTAIAWGVNGAADRIVCSGNPDYPNIDYISEYNNINGSYWSDQNYQVVGGAVTKIMGYRRIQSYLAIIKEDNGQDSTVFLRSGSLDDDGNAVWATYPCLSGVGAISRFGFGNINDDQLVLTGNGIYAITSSTITAEKIAENRSIRINPKLIKEDLSGAICASFRNLFMVFIDGKVYMLDGKHAKTYESRNDTTYSYEGYYWEDIPAESIMKTTDDGNEQLYFGTDDGEIMQIKWDEETVYKYSDEMSITWVDNEKYGQINYTDGKWYDSDGEETTLATYGITSAPTAVEGDQAVITEDGADYYRAIKCVWATNADDDGDPMIYKTLLKKGNAVTLKPYKRSSAKVCIRTDNDVTDWQCNYGTMDVFDWTDIDFSRFTFNTNDNPREIPFNRKIKNYKRLQILVRNDKVNEGFGIFCIVKHYVTGNFAKR